NPMSSLEPPRDQDRRRQHHRQLENDEVSDNRECAGLIARQPKDDGENDTGAEQDALSEATPAVEPAIERPCKSDSRKRQQLEQISLIECQTIVTARAGKRKHRQQGGRDQRKQT